MEKPIFLGVQYESEADLISWITKFIKQLKKTKENTEAKQKSVENLIAKCEAELKRRKS